jgi:DinB superfamily
MTWNSLLREQIDWHWSRQVRGRLDGLTDAEYLWEPAPGCWSVRDGAIDYEAPPPDPAPLTTIAWRLGHVIVGVLAMRNATHFGRAATDYRSFPYATTAAGALAQLDAEYATWLAGVESLGETDLHRPCGEDGYASHPMAALVLHINRELIHHLAEVCLLRDLYLRQEAS